MGLILDLGTPKEEELQTAEKDNEISTFKSVMAGLGSGLFKIPEGFISTGAMFYDLFNDTEKAAEVEKYFAKIKLNSLFTAALNIYNFKTFN